MSVRASVIAATTDTRIAATVAAGMTGTPLLGWIEGWAAVVAVIVGIVLSLVLIIKHSFTGYITYKKTRLENEKLRLEIEARREGFRGK